MTCPMEKWHSVFIHNNHIKELYDILCIHKNNKPDDCKDCILSEMTYRFFVSDYAPIEEESICDAIRYKKWIDKGKTSGNI